MKVILLVIDTLRVDHLGCYGYNRKTSPYIDQLAEESVVYENAFQATYQSSHLSLPCSPG